MMPLAAEVTVNCPLTNDGFEALDALACRVADVEPDVIVADVPIGEQGLLPGEQNVKFTPFTTGAVNVMLPVNGET